MWSLVSRSQTTIPQSANVIKSLGQQRQRAAHGSDACCSDRKKHSSQKWKHNRDGITERDGITSKKLLKEDITPTKPVKEDITKQKKMSPLLWISFLAKRDYST